MERPLSDILNMHVTLLNVLDVDSLLMEHSKDWSKTIKFSLLFFLIEAYKYCEEDDTLFRYVYFHRIES